MRYLYFYLTPENLTSENIISFSKSDTCTFNIKRFDASQASAGSKRYCSRRNR